MTANVHSFAEWLANTSDGEISLCRIASTLSHLFLLDYCSLHVNGITGTSDCNQDKSLNLDQLIDEQALTVRYSPILHIGFLVTKADSHDAALLDEVAAMIGIRLSHTNGLMKIL